MSTTRRTFLAAAFAVLAAPLAAEAQQAGKVYRVGILGAGTDAFLDQPSGRALLQGLRELGWVEGQNFRIDLRFTDGKTERVDAQVAELIRVGVDVIVTTGTPATLAAKRATRNIPVVFASMGFPVERGAVASLARPGGNVTGVAFVHGSPAKGFQLLKEAAPRISRVARLRDPRVSADDLGAARQADQAFTTEARALGIELKSIDVTAPTDVDAALARLPSARVDGLFVPRVGPVFLRREQICDFARAHRLPAFAEGREFAEAGCLVAYAPDVVAIFRQAATYVDRILRGARPGDLPVDLPTKFELVINLKTAKALGLTIPPSLLLRADHVIQ